MTVLSEMAAWDDLAERLRCLAGEAEVGAAEFWLRERWLCWQPLVREMRFAAGDAAEPLLALWLDQAVETAVDLEWKSSPGNAYLLDRLAAELCMAELRRRLPGEHIDCAPLPPARPELLAALRQAGLAAPAPPGGGAVPTLTRRYAVLTYERPRGCAACALRPGCPKVCK